MDGRHSSPRLLHHFSSRPLRWLLRGGVAICVAAGGVLALASGPSAAAQVDFAQATEVTAPSNAGSDPLAQLFGVSCPSTSNCVGVGDYRNNSGNNQAMEVTETGGTFAQATEVTPPPNAASTNLVDSTLQTVSCTSVGNCVGVGGYVDSSGNGQAMEVTETGGTFAQATEVTPPSNAGSGADLLGVSCTSVGNCVGVGGYVDSSGNDQAMEVTETGGTFAPATEVTAPSNAASDPQAGLLAVSCTSVGNCVAVGSYVDSSSSGQQLMVATETGGTFAPATEVTAPSNAGSAGPLGQLDGISCPTVGDCVAVGVYTDSSGYNQAMEATETGGTFAPATEVTPPSNADSETCTNSFGNCAHANLLGVSCTSVGNCVGAGSYIDNTGDTKAMEATETGGTFAPATEVTAPSNGDSIFVGAVLDAASCTSSTDCVVVGNYSDSSFRVQAMAAISPPPPPTTSVALPSNNATVNGDTWLDAAASASAGIASVHFEVSGNSISDQVISSSPVKTAYGWIGGWDTTDVPNGIYSLQSVVTDTLGQTTTSAPISVTVANQPLNITVLVPASGATLSAASAVLDASASGTSDITGVNYVINGGSISNEVIGPATSSIWGWYAIWNLTAVPSGTYTIESTATEAGGGTATSAPITVTVNSAG